MNDLAKQTTPPNPAFMSPTIQLEQVIKVKADIDRLIQKALVPEHDFGIIPGTGKKPSLLKPGAEQVLKWFGCIHKATILESEHDHNMVCKYVANVWENNVKKEVTKQSRGFHRYVVRMDLINVTTEKVIGSGLGAASTLEKKYVSRPNDSENTALKMAAKRALVDAVLVTFALSGRFTQDVEDMPNFQNGNSNQKPKPKPDDPSMATLPQKKRAWAMAKERAYNTGEMKKLFSTITGKESSNDWKKDDVNLIFAYFETVKGNSTPTKSDDQQEAPPENPVEREPGEEG